MPKDKNRNAYMREYLQKRRDAGTMPDRREYFKARRKRLNADRFANAGKVITTTKDAQQ